MQDYQEKRIVSIYFMPQGCTCAYFFPEARKRSSMVFEIPKTMEDAEVSR